MTATDAPAVRVVVVTFSPGHDLELLLKSLSESTTLHYEVVLADNGSTDGAPQRAVAEHGVTLLAMKGNEGYGRAANAGAAGNEAPYILICNSDLEFTDGALDKLVAAAERWSTGASFGPTILDGGGNVYPSARAMPSPMMGIGHALLGWWWASNPFSRRYRGESLPRHERQAGWLSGACLLVRDSAFRSIGGFDPGFFMYFEDVDLGDRLRRAGWQNIYVPQARVVHVGGTTTARHHSLMLDVHHASAYRYLTARWPRALHPLLRAGLRFRHAIVSRRG